MPQPIGTWDINANGFPGGLLIQGIDANGNLVGSTVFGQSIVGFWDEAAEKITFIRVIDQADPSTYQIFTGYRMDPQPGLTLAMAGSFEAFQGTGATAERVLYGWFATPTPLIR
jgi:hypothetical protein